MGMSDLERPFDFHSTIETGTVGFESIVLSFEEFYVFRVIYFLLFYVQKSVVGTSNFGSTVENKVNDSVSIVLFVFIFIRIFGLARLKVYNDLSLTVSKVNDWERPCQENKPTRGTRLLFIRSRFVTNKYVDFLGVIWVVISIPFVQLFRGYSSTFSLSLCA